MQAVINDILTEYNILGLKNNEDIIIIHGWGQSSKDWEYVAQTLSDKYRVVVLDLPGFGGSSLPPKPYNTEMYAKFIKNFIEKLGLRKVILIGHSLGGKISICLSAGSTNIKKLFLIAPSGIENKSVITIVKIILVKILKVFLFWLPLKIRQKYVYLLGSRDYLNAGEMRETLKKVINENVTKQAAKIKVPTVIVWGEKDEEVNLKTSKKLRGLIKNSTLRIIWGERHSVNIESPDKLLSILADYL